jgi:hypothetical protein
MINLFIDKSQDNKIKIIVNNQLSINKDKKVVKTFIQKAN